MSPAADLTVSGGLLLTGNIWQPSCVSLGWNEEHHWTFSVTEHSGRLCGCCQTGGVVQWRAVEVYWSLWIKWFMNLFVWESKSQRLTDRVCSVPCGLEIKTVFSANTLYASFILLNAFVKGTCRGFVSFTLQPGACHFYVSFHFLRSSEMVFVFYKKNVIKQVLSAFAKFLPDVVEVSNVWRTFSEPLCN